MDGMRALKHSARGRAGMIAALVVFAGLGVGIGPALSAPRRARQEPQLCPAKTPARIAPERSAAARRELAPPGVGSIALCRYSSLNDHPPLSLTHSRLISRQSIVRKLVREFDHLPRGPRGPVACPSDDGSEILALLRYPQGREVTISVHLTGCTPATNGSVSRMATQGLIAQLERLVDSPTTH